MKKSISIIIFNVFVYNFCAAHINQVIVPMAGLGTRLLPITKAAPKSMVALIDKPALHYIVDEALQSNMNDLCFIINENEYEAIANYFSPNPELDAILSERNKLHLLKEVNSLISRAQFTYIVQPQPLGLGHAVLMGKPFIRPYSFFGVMLPDNIIETDTPHMEDLIALAEMYNASIITIEEITYDQASQYAVVIPKSFLTEDLIEVEDIIEKPQVAGDTLCLGQMGRHVFSYDIFESLEAIEPGVGNEIQLTDAVRHMIQNGQRVLAYKLKGNRYDIGNIKGLLEATVTLALHNPLYRPMLCSIFKEEMSKN